MTDAINPDPRAVLDAWDPILAARRPANQGHPVNTDRGAEAVYTILATAWDLDELRAGLAAWKADRERLAMAKQMYEAMEWWREGTAVDAPAESTRHPGTLVDEARAAIRRVAEDPGVDSVTRDASLAALLMECDYLMSPPPAVDADESEETA